MWVGRWIGQEYIFYSKHSYEGTFIIVCTIYLHDKTIAVQLYGYDHDFTPLFWCVSWNSLFPFRVLKASEDMSLCIIARPISMSYCGRLHLLQCIYDVHPSSRTNIQSQILGAMKIKVNRVIHIATMPKEYCIKYHQILYFGQIVT